MASTMTRRPLPALVSLLALLVLTGIVWWRVANRDDSSGAAKPPARTCSTAAAPARTTPPPASLTPKDVTVLVLNSTNRQGIASTARTALLADGFRIPRPAGNDSTNPSNPKVAEIRYGASGRAGAELLQYYLPGSALVRTDTSSATVTVSLGTAYRSVATAAQVEAAMASATASAPGSAAPTAAPTC